MCGVEHPDLCHCLGALLLGLARAGVMPFSGFIPDFAPSYSTMKIFPRTLSTLV